MLCGNSDNTKKIQKTYNPPRIFFVNRYINKNNHLPDVPSGNEVIENGINVAEMIEILLQKIEELTLYTIEQQKQIEDIKKENDKLEKIVK